MQEIYPGDALDITIFGRGGTDFRPPFQWVADNAIEPDIFIYITDGCGPAPEIEPDYPVIWLSTDEFPADWGERICTK